MAEIRITENSDGTVTVRNGRKVASFDARGLTSAEIVERCRWEFVSLGLAVDLHVAMLPPRLREGQQ